MSGPGSVSDQVGSAGVATTVPRAGVRQFAGGQPPAAPPEALGTPPSSPPHASTPLPFSPAEFSLRLFVPESILPATLPLPLTSPHTWGWGVPLSWRVQVVSPAARLAVAAVAAAAGCGWPAHVLFRWSSYNWASGQS